MGRHGAPAPRRTVPWELLGWGVFASLVAAVAVLWMGGSAVSAVLVAAIGLLGVVVLTLVSLSGSSRPHRRPPP